MLDQGFLFSSDPVSDEAFQGDPLYVIETNALQKITNNIPLESMLKEDGFVRVFREYADYLYKVTVYRSRIQSVFLRRTMGLDTYPVCDNLHTLDEVLLNLPKAHVMSVVLKKTSCTSSRYPLGNHIRFSIRSRHPD